MIPSHRTATHPGEILQEEYLSPLEVTQSAFAKHLGVPFQRINELINGKRGITPETALMLAGALNTSPQYWMNLQAAFDLTSTRLERVVKPLFAREVAPRKKLRRTTA